MLQGASAVVVQRVTDDSGQVRLNGELWRARPYAGTGPVDVGKPVSVASRRRRHAARLLVRPVLAPSREAPRGLHRGHRLLVVAALVAVVLFKTVRIVPQASVFVIERLGKYSRTLEPGIHLLVPVVDHVRSKMDIREQVVGFPPQAVITKDNLVVGIDSVIYYSIMDPASAQYKIENVVTAIEQLVVTTLRNVVGGMQLEEALTGRDHINERLATVLDEATGKWGVKVNRVEIRGIEPPPTIRDAMEQAMRADRGKRAAILTAEGQQQSVVLSAQGSKQSVVLNAEADRAATILRAEAEPRGAAAARRRARRRRSRPSSRRSRQRGWTTRCSPTSASSCCRASPRVRPTRCGSSRPTSPVRSAGSGWDREALVVPCRSGRRTSPGALRSSSSLRRSEERSW